MGLGAWVKAVFFGALGVAGLYVLLGSLNLLRKVAFTRVSRPGSVDPGRAEVVGRVEPASEPVIAPLSGAECVGYVLRQEVHRKRAGTAVSLPCRRST